MASMTPISSPVRLISGTTPEVDSVMRRFDSDMPSPSEAISSAAHACRNCRAARPCPS
jgi:hypothetical protein